MSNLALILDTIAAEAAKMCTQCLIDYVSEESDSLNEKVCGLADASALRNSRRDGEAQYDTALGELINTVLVIAVFTAELSNNRAVAWKDTDQDNTVQVSLN